VLLMDSPQNQQSTANQLLKEFEMVLDYEKSVKGEIFDQRQVSQRQVSFGEKVPHGERVSLGEFDQPACQIKGGDALLADRKGNAVLAIKKEGTGLIAVFGASHLFRDESLGSTSTVPDEYQRWLSEMEFWIFESLAKKEFIPFSLYSQAGR